MRSFTTLACVVVVFGSATGLRGAEQDIVSMWDNIVSDVSLLSQAPKNGIVEDRAQFEKIWKNWKVEDKAAPNIDFDKHFVFVYTNQGTKHNVAQFFRDNGNFHFVICKGGKYKSTKIDGFHYQMVVVKKGKVKGFGEKTMVANFDK